MKRLPDDVKKVRGTLRKDRTTSQSARTSGARKVRVSAQVPRPPAGSSRDVRAFYRRHALTLAKSGRLTEDDWPAFSLLAQTYAIAAEAVRVIATEGYFRFDENKVQRKHPALQVHRDAAQTFARLASRFGMTPKDRENMPDDEPGDALAQALFAAATGGSSDD